MTSLTDVQRELLKDLVSESEQQSGVDALRFRVKHEEHRGDLDALEQNRVIERQDGKYRINLIGLAELRGQTVEADKLLRRCEQIFDVLREIYKADLERQIRPAEIAHLTGLTDSEVRSTLRWLVTFHIFRGHKTDLTASDAYVIVAERILDYKTFEDVLTELRRWWTPRPTLYERGREKQQKFKILDSPTLLEPDLKAATAPLGCAVLYMDLDDFKAINTSLTEVIVDKQVLPALHRCLNELVDRLGYAYGEGGDEITILLVNADAQMTLTFAEAVRRRIEALTFDGKASDLRLTASIGIAWAAPGEERTTLRERSNEAKNLAKKHGKNCIALSDGADTRVVKLRDVSDEEPPAALKNEGRRSFALLRERANRANRALGVQGAQQKVVEAILDRLAETIHVLIDKLRVHFEPLANDFDLSFGDAGVVVSTPGVDGARVYKGREVCVEAKRPAQIRLHSGLAVVATIHTTFVLVARHVLEIEEGPRRACLWESLRTMPFRSDSGEKHLEDLLSELIGESGNAVMALVAELESRAGRHGS